MVSSGQQRHLIILYLRAQGDTAENRLRFCGLLHGIIPRVRASSFGFSILASRAALGSFHDKWIDFSQRAKKA